MTGLADQLREIELADSQALYIELAFNPHELRIPSGLPHAGEWVHSPVDKPGTGIHRYVVPDPERLVIPPPKKAGRKNYYERPEDQPFFQAHPVSPENILAYYDRADEGIRAQGRDWYAQNHEVARTIGGGNAEEGAILLSAYSPQKPWPYNMFQAMKSARRGRALGPGEGMAITGANQKQAQMGIDGKSVDEALAGPKTHSFGVLLKQGDDSPDDPYGHVVIDTHALNIAAGGTIRGDEQDKTPVGTARYHEYVADQYREAARRISEREGKLMKPHQLQAITWMVQQQQNQAADAYAAEHGQLGKKEAGRAKGRASMTRNAWKVWTAYAKQHNVQLIPGISSLAAQIALSQLIELTEPVRTMDVMAMAFNPGEPRGPGGKWTDVGGWDDLGSLLDREFGPDPEEGRRVRHPRSGYMVEAGEWRRVNHPPPSEHGNESLGIEGPATFDVRDHGDPNSPEYNSLKYMNPQVIRTEPIKHVYRGMSAGEWKQAQERGYISSDRRGAISDLEGTNAAVDPRSAVSYLPREGDAVVAKIAVRPQDNWFTINADNYLRTRSRVPVSAVEHVLPMRKIKIGRNGEGLEYQQADMACASCGCPVELAFNPHEPRIPKGMPGAGRWLSSMHLPDGSRIVRASTAERSRVGPWKIISPDGREAFIGEKDKRRLTGEPAGEPVKAFEFMGPHGSAAGAAFLPGNREPEVGDMARSDPAGHLVVGRVTSKAGGHAVVEADDGNRYLVDWRNGGQVRMANPLAQAGPEAKDDQGQWMRAEDALAAARKIAQEVHEAGSEVAAETDPGEVLNVTPPYLRETASAWMKRARADWGLPDEPSHGAALRAKQHANRRAALQTWTVNERGDIVRHAHPGIHGQEPGPSYSAQYRIAAADAALGLQMKGPGAPDGKTVMSLYPPRTGEEPHAYRARLAKALDKPPASRTAGNLSEQLMFPGMPETQRGIGPAAARRSLEKGIESNNEHDSIPGEDVRADQPYGMNYFGNTADTKMVDFADGSHWVRKRGVPEEDLQREALYTRVSDVLGAGAPEGLIRYDDRDEAELWMPRVDGQTAIEWTGFYDPEQDEEGWGAPGGEDPEDMYLSERGQRIGLADAITGMVDRHMGNWMVEQDADGNDQPVPIDNNASFGPYGNSGFADHLALAEHPWDAQQWAEWNAGLTALKQEFIDADKENDWDRMMESFRAARHEATSPEWAGQT